MTPRIDWSDGDGSTETGTTIYPRNILLGSILPVAAIAAAVASWLNIGRGPVVVRIAITALAIVVSLYALIFIFALVSAMLRSRSISKGIDQVFNGIGKITRGEPSADQDS